MTIIDMDKMGEALNTKADIDLNNTGVFSTSEGRVNLTSSTPNNASGKEVTSADFIKSDIQSNLLNYTTNRILEIPQDIKLELNNGTLTLKAGSKVYALDGSSYTIPSDKTLDYSNTEPHSSWILVKENGEMGDIWTLESVSSISIGSKWVTFRETNYYLPICVATHNADGTTKTGWKSIDQVFNGFGYIGSTVFVFPNVKSQSSIGRNADGTCTNLVRTVSSVLTYEAGPWNNATLYFLLWTNACEGQDVRRFTRNKEFSSQAATYSFDENENKWYFSNNSQIWHDSGFALNIVGKFVIASGKITSFEPFTVDSVLNSSLSNLSAAGEAKLKSNIQLVNELPANPEPGVLYCIPEA